MAWIPLLLASWIVLDVLIVAIVLAIASRKRHREQRSVATTAAELRSPSRATAARLASVPPRRPIVPLR